MGKSGKQGQESPQGWTRPSLAKGHVLTLGPFVTAPNPEAERGELAGAEVTAPRASQAACRRAVTCRTAMAPHTPLQPPQSKGTWPLLRFCLHSLTQGIWGPHSLALCRKGNSGKRSYSAWTSTTLRGHGDPSALPSGHE